MRAARHRLDINTAGGTGNNKKKLPKKQSQSLNTQESAGVSTHPANSITNYLLT
jgi:hypothetical protein